jgi:hypothetical protein
MSERERVSQKFTNYDGVNLKICDTFQNEESYLRDIFTQPYICQNVQAC